METNKIDKIVKKEFQNRTLQPSVSAWERLSNDLDTQQEQRKKKRWFFYIGYAASILVLISLGFMMFTGETTQKIHKTIIVEQPIDTSFINKKLDQFKLQNEIIEEAIVKTKVDEIIDEKKQVKAPISKINKKHKQSKVPLIARVDKKKAQKTKIEAEIDNQDNIVADVVIAKTAIVTTESIPVAYQAIIEANKNAASKNTGIKIKSDDLLFAVTHTQEEVLAYYTKYNVDRNDVLKTIQKELNKTNLKIDPTTILAEVERDINEDTFKNNFLRSIKNRVTDIATAIASRNN
jgi:hypothetical protein